MHLFIFQRILGCFGECSRAIEVRERVCSSNSSCLLRLSFPCYNKSACADRCIGTCTGEWFQTKMRVCPVFCDGGKRAVEYMCKNQSETNEIYSIVL